MLLVGGLSTVPAVLGRIASANSVSPDEAAMIVELVPRAIAEAPCFLDKLTGLWRYEFGFPIQNLAAAGTVLGTHMFPPVEHLFHVLRCAHGRLQSDELAGYLHRLSDPNKHQDVLFEFAPIVRLSRDVEVKYEVPGCGAGNETIDWRITRQSHLPMLLDVKNRMRDVIEALEQIGRGEQSPAGTGPAPMHDPALLFRSIESKFRRAKPDGSLQGAWIGTYLKQEEGELYEAFRRLDTDKVHFAVLGDWRNDGYILVRGESLRAPVREVLGIEESRRFVFKRDEG